MRKMGKGQEGRGSQGIQACHNTAGDIFVTLVIQHDVQADRPEHMSTARTGAAYRLAIRCLDFAVLTGWCSLRDEAHTPPAHTLLHLLLDHLHTHPNLHQRLMMS